jgi:hypothetical protein
VTERADNREAWRELAEEVRRRADIFAVIGRHARVTRRGRNGSACCPFHNEKSPSFHIYGGRDAHYHCYGCGAHGDVITFVMQWSNVEFKAALGELADDVGLGDRFAEITGAKVARRSPEEERRRQEKRARQAKDWAAERDREEERRTKFMIALALHWWNQGVSSVDTLVQIYLQARIPGYGCPPASLRFHPAVPETFDPDDPANTVTWPAMLGGVQGPDRRIRGLHITYLARDGSWKAPVKNAKRMLGICWGGAVRLSPVFPGKPFFVGEGIETVETVQHDLGTGSGTFWAALSHGNMAGSGDAEKQARAPFHPTKRRKDPQTGEETGPRLRLPTVYPDFDRPGIVVPAEASEAVLLCDGDSDPPTERALMRRATTRIQHQGKPVRQAWAKPGMDFNDMARSAAAAE